MGTPRDADDAVAMLMRLSGCSHQVMTAAAAAVPMGLLDMTVIATVTFRTLSQAEVEAYWHLGRTMSKAGSYSLQGQDGQCVTCTDGRPSAGRPSAVAGLPLAETALLLRQQGPDPLG